LLLPQEVIAMLPFHSRRRACGVLCATLFTSLGLSLFTTGCSQSVEESKAFQREVARAQRIDDDLRVTNAQLTEIKTQLETLTTSVGALQTAGGAPGGLEALKALEQRLIRLEANAAARGGAAKPVAVKAETPAPAAEPAADEPAAEPAETETIVAESRSTKQPVVELEAVEADEKVTVKKTSRKATSERKSGGERALRAFLESNHRYHFKKNVKSPMCRTGALAGHGHQYDAAPSPHHSPPSILCRTGAPAGHCHQYDAAPSPAPLPAINIV
jgi:TolA-binding protein